MLLQGGVTGCLRQTPTVIVVCIQAVHNMVIYMNGHTTSYYQNSRGTLAVSCRRPPRQKSNQKGCVVTACSSAPTNHITHLCCLLCLLMVRLMFLLWQFCPNWKFLEKRTKNSWVQKKCGGNSCISTCPNMRPETRSRPWMRSGLRIAGIVYDCNCWHGNRSVSVIAAFTLQARFSC